MGQKMPHVVRKDVFADKPVSQVLFLRGDIAQNGINKDVFVAFYVEAVSRTHELTESPLVIHPLQALGAEKVSQNVLKPCSIAGEILVKDGGYLSLEHKHSGKNPAAVAPALLLIERTVR